MTEKAAPRRVKLRSDIEEPTVHLSKRASELPSRISLNMDTDDPMRRTLLSDNADPI